MTTRNTRKLYSVLRLLLLFSLGALLAGAAELPYGGWLQIPILSVVWCLLSCQKIPSLKQHFLSGMLFGLGYFVLGLWWIYISLHDVGGMHPLISCIAVLLLAAGMALFFMTASLSIIFFKTARMSGLLLAASWVVMEYLRGSILTGFPWMGFAEAQINGPFAPIAPLFGGLACTFLVVWISWEITRLKQTVTFSMVCICLAITLSQLAGIWHFTNPIGEPISVRLIQGNFEQSLKFNPLAIQKQFAFYTSTITAKPADLIVSPETAYPWPQNSLPLGVLSSLQAFSNTSSSNLLFGVIGEVSDTNNTQYSNRALGLSPNKPSYQYDKSHLVPFGEFIPPGFHWFVQRFSVPLSDFSRGPKDQSFFLINREGQSPLYAAITICYEDVFGGELATRLRDSQEPANLLINMTNLAWFGASQAPAQQLRLSQLRSLETGLPAIRAANTGITAVLGADGRVVAQLPEFTEGVLSAMVQAYSGKTPYVIWGNIPILSISFLLLIFGLTRQKRFW